MAPFSIRACILGALAFVSCDPVEKRLFNVDTGSIDCFDPNVYNLEEEFALLRYTVVFHQIVREDGSGGHEENQLQEWLDYLNRIYAPINIQFTQGTIYYIYDSELYEEQETEEVVRNVPMIAGAINIILVDEIMYKGKTYGGITQYVDDQKFIAISRGRSAKLVAHEFGHYFGLFHTFEDGNGKELVDGSNARFAGDRIVETPADPGVGFCSLNKNCNPISCPMDDQGDEYVPDTGNFMSYYGSCWQHFVREQELIMRCTAQHRLPPVDFRSGHIEETFYFPSDDPNVKTIF